MKAPKCVRGCGKATKGANYCGRCGAKLPTVTKAAGMVRTFYNPAFAGSAGVASPVLRKAATKSTYVPVWDRGALYDEDPWIRERAWQDMYGAALVKGR